MNVQKPHMFTIYLPTLTTSSQPCFTPYNRSGQLYPPQRQMHFFPPTAFCSSHDVYNIQGCALRKISGSPSGPSGPSQAFYLSRPDLKVGRPNKNFGEPFGLPSIPAGVPRPLKLVARVHLIRKYFVRTRILLAR